MKLNGGGGGGGQWHLFPTPPPNITMVEVSFNTYWDTKVGIPIGGIVHFISILYRYLN